MAMSREEHEALLTELADGSVEESRKFEILQAIRNDNIASHESFEEANTKNNQLMQENKEFQLSNSQLWRQLGTEKKEETPEIEEQTFSETITLTDLENDDNLK